MEALTAREREVLRLTAHHLRVRDIAGVMKISPFTVRKHRMNLCAKLGLTGTAQLAAYALRQTAGVLPAWNFPDARAVADPA